MTGTLIIKEYPTKSASSRSIRTHLEKLRMRDINPDMMIIDYGDLLRPISGKNEKRHELESIYEEMLRLSINVLSQILYFLYLGQ